MNYFMCFKRLTFLKIHASITGSPNLWTCYLWSFVLKIFLILLLSLSNDFPVEFKWLLFFPPRHASKTPFTKNPIFHFSQSSMLSSFWTHPSSLFFSFKFRSLVTFPQTCLSPLEVRSSTRSNGLHAFHAWLHFLRRRVHQRELTTFYWIIGLNDWRQRWCSSVVGKIPQVQPH